MRILAKASSSSKVNVLFLVITEEIPYIFSTSIFRDMEEGVTCNTEYYPYTVKCLMFTQIDPFHVNPMKGALVVIIPLLIILMPFRKTTFLSSA
jgi:hypothetical protein